MTDEIKLILIHKRNIEHFCESQDYHKRRYIAKVDHIRPGGEHVTKKLPCQLHTAPPVHPGNRPELEMRVINVDKNDLPGTEE